MNSNSLFSSDLHLSSFNFFDPIRLFVIVFVLMVVIGFFFTLSLFILVLCYSLHLCIQFLLHGKTSHGYDYEITEINYHTQMNFEENPVQNRTDIPLSGQKQKVFENLGEVSEYGSHGRTSGSSECIICLDEFGEEDECHVFPKCKHIFHAKCIIKWLKIHLNCPICRTQLVQIDIQSRN